MFWEESSCDTVYIGWLCSEVFRDRVVLVNVFALLNVLFDGLINMKFYSVFVLLLLFILFKISS